MKNSQLSDAEFLVAFEAATLAEFHHADHIRAAWIYLRRLPFSQAAERMAESLRHFAASRGAHMKYHETITLAWIRLVSNALEQDQRVAGGERALSCGADPHASPVASRINHAVNGFDAFAAGHPELLDVHGLKRFYSSQLLATPTARTQFVPPDLAPLPYAASRNF